MMFSVNLMAGPGGDGYDIGDIVEDFSLKNIDGEMFSLYDMENAEGVIVIFTCNTCPYAVATEDRVIALDKKYSSQGYPVVAINPNDVNKKPGDSYEKMQARAEEKGYTFPYLLDNTQEVARTFGATRTPHVYLLQKNNNGKMRVAFIGAIDDKPMDPDRVEQHFLQDAIRSLQNNEKPDPAKVKAVGCTIKWAES